MRAGGHVRQGRQRGELRGHLAVRGPAHERRGQREVRAPQPDGPLGQEDGDRERSQQDRRVAQGVRAQGLPARAAGRLPGRPEAPLEAQRGAHKPRVERPCPAEAQRVPAHAPAQGREARLIRLVVEVLVAQEARAGRGERPRGPVGVALVGGERREGGSLALDLVHQGPDVVPAGDLHGERPHEREGAREVGVRLRERVGRGSDLVAPPAELRGRVRGAPHRPGHLHEPVGQEQARAGRTAPCPPWRTASRLRARPRAST